MDVPKHSLIFITKGVAKVRRDYLSSIANNNDHNQQTTEKDPNKPRVCGDYWFVNKMEQISWYTDPANHPTINYSYNIVDNKTIYKNITGLHRCSVVPYIIKKGDKKWILGSFVDIPYIFKDYGGYMDISTDSELPINNIMRHLSLETRGILNSPVLTSIKANKYQTYLGTSDSNRNNKNKNHKQNVITILVDITGEIDDIGIINKRIKQKYYLDTTTKIGKLQYLSTKCLMDKRRKNKPIYTNYYLTHFFDYYFSKLIRLKSEFNQTVSQLDSKYSDNINKNNSKKLVKPIITISPY